MSFWSKAKGVFSRIGQGIKTGASKAYNWITNNRDKLEQATKSFNDLTNSKYADKIGTATNYLDKGIDLVSKFVPR